MISIRDAASILGILLETKINIVFFCIELKNYNYNDKSIILRDFRAEMPDMKATEPQEVEKEEEQDESEDKPQPAPIKDKKHDSGAADLEKGKF